MWWTRSLRHFHFAIVPVSVTAEILPGAAGHEARFQ
jgi:hypothetical protein